LKSNIFLFWSKLKRGQRIHPADKTAFKMMNPKRHGFQLQCLPASFSGKLRTASVVLLYLSPGYRKTDDADARSKSGKDYYSRRWKGREPLRDSGPGAEWYKSRTRIFGDYAIVRKKIAMLNIGAYHSKTVQSYACLLALPSSRQTLDWAQSYLFVEAQREKRIVICMRSPPYWGLEKGKKYRGTLFAPKTTRSGHLIKDQSGMKIIQLVRHLKL
jgi:hypothetical protein